MSVNFKEKKYELKKLFIREEAALAKQLQRLADEDLEIKADAMIEVCAILTGIDKGDLNGSSLNEVNALMKEIMAERKSGQGEAKAPAQGAEA